MFNICNCINLQQLTLKEYKDTILELDKVYTTLQESANLA